MSFVSALDPNALARLRTLEQQLRRFYANPAYHAEWIKGANADWQPGVHDAQLALAQRIPAAARLLEIGCGDARAAQELLRRIPALSYFGVDITVPQKSELRVAAASARVLPFPNAYFDVVISMFTIEHTPFPHRFLEEAWRVLRPGGKLCIVAPDFLKNAMASERIGLAYGNGREKLRRGQLFDALLTLVDSRVRLPWQRRRRRVALARREYIFPVLLQPRCLSHAGFVTDCDAVYPSCPEEIGNYLQARHQVQSQQIFFRDRNSFGIELAKP